MLALFLAFFFVSITALFIFLLKLPVDLKKQSLRPLFFMLVSIAFWVGTMSVLYVPESTQTTTVSLPYNITALTTQTPSTHLFAGYFYIWSGMLLFLIFLTILWVVLLLRTKAIEAAHEGRDVMSKFDEQFSRR